MTEALATSAEVAEYLGIAVQTLGKWRQREKGPAFVKLERGVRYEWAEVDRWVAENKRGGQ